MPAPAERIGRPHVVTRRYSQPAIETATRSDVEAETLRGLQGFLSDHVMRVPFYRERARRAGLDLTRLGSVDALRAFPVLRKQDVLEQIRADPPFGTLLAAQPAEIAHFVETSGTSGHGSERYALTADDLGGLTSQQAFGFVWAGVGRGDFVATTYPMSSKAAGRWHALGVEAAGGVYVPLGGVEAASKLEYIRALGVSTVIASPSYVRRLEVEAGRQEIALHDLSVTALMVSGEAFSVQWAEEREEIWGARVYEQYGSSQRALAWSCDEGAVTEGRHGAVHCPSHLAYYEVIDPASGDHVHPGEVGEMVITPFSSSRGMPLVRFASGDRVRFLGHDACSCGRPFPAIEAGTVQRYDSRLRVKGVNIEPETLDPLILGDAVADYDAIIAFDEAGRETVTVRVEAREGATLGDPELAGLGERLRSATGLGYVVEQSDGPLPPDATTGKRSRWRDLRNR